MDVKICTLSTFGLRDHEYELCDAASYNQHPSDVDFVDQFRTEPEPKLIALQKNTKKESTIDEFKLFSITRSNQHSVK